MTGPGCACVRRASNWNWREYRRFRDWNEMAEYMRALYNSWVVEFLNDPDDPFRRDIESSLGRDCGYYVDLLIYDDCIE